MKLWEACRDGNEKLVKSMLRDSSIDPREDNNAAIIWATYIGHFEIVKLLLLDDRVDPTSDDNLPLRMAIREDYFDIVKMLLADKRIDPSNFDNCALRTACEFNPSVIPLLLKDPRVVEHNLDKIISQFPQNGMIELLKSAQYMVGGSKYNKIEKLFQPQGK